MAEPQAFALIFSVILLLVGLPMLLFGILQYISQPSTGFFLLGLSISMLFLGTIFLMVILTQK